MPHLERLDELAPLAAIGALDGADREEFDRHLVEGCRRCDASVREWERAMAPLAWTVPSVSPPPPVRSRLRVAAAGEPVLPFRARPRWAEWLAVAACLALVVAVTDDVARRRSNAEFRSDDARLEREVRQAREQLAEKTLRARFLEDPDVQAILLSGTGPQPGARGKIVFSPRARRAIFVTAALAPLPKDRQYELWFIAGGKPIAAGVFDRAAGATVVESRPLPESVARGDKFAVTIEPTGGGDAPTGPMVLIGG